MGKACGKWEAEADFTLATKSAPESGSFNPTILVEIATAIARPENRGAERSRIHFQDVRFGQLNRRLLRSNN
jgi:hypothetical protein